MQEPSQIVSEKGTDLVLAEATGYSGGTLADLRVGAVENTFGSHRNLNSITFDLVRRTGPCERLVASAAKTEERKVDLGYQVFENIETFLDYNRALRSGINSDS